MFLNQNYYGEIEALKALEEEQGKMNELGRKTRALLQKSEQFSARINRLLRLMENQDLHSQEAKIDYEDYLAEQKSLYDQFHSYIGLVYDTLSEANAFSEKFSLEGYRGKQVGQNIFGIKAFMQGEDIVFRLPMLGKREPHVIISGGRPIAVDHMPIYARDIQRAAIRLIEEYDVNPQDYLVKDVSFYFVYPPDEHNILDSDNHDTKASLDAATAYFGGDAARICRVRYETVRTKQLEKGTYIRIQKRLEFSEDNSFLQGLARKCG